MYFIYRRYYIVICMRINLIHVISAGRLWRPTFGEWGTSRNYVFGILWQSYLPSDLHWGSCLPRLDLWEGRSVTDWYIVWESECKILIKNNIYQILEWLVYYVSVPMTTHCTITRIGFHARRIDVVECGLFSNDAPLGQTTLRVGRLPV